ncbi:MAG: hypothetical protein R3C11_12565 [Planctomycetaceae bacterium]
MTFFSISGKIPDDWYLKFNKLYTELRFEQEKPEETIAERLQLAEAPTASPTPAEGNDAPPGDVQPASSQPGAADAEAEFSPELLMGIVAGLGAILFLIILFLGSRRSSRNRKRTRHYRSFSEEAPQLPNGPVKKRTAQSAATRSSTSRRTRPPHSQN